MPRRTWNPQEAVTLHLQGLTWREIAEQFGVAGESTVREGVRRYLGQTERDTRRSQAAQTASGARWGSQPRGSGSDRTFGVELEFHTAIRADVVRAVEAVVGYHIHMTGYHGNTCVTCRNRVSGYQHWKLETDSSATNGMLNAGSDPQNQGGELVSPVLRGQEGLEELAKVIAALRSVGAVVDYRHGMHTHLGVNDMSPEQRGNLFDNYRVAQDQIFRLVAKSRRTNRYCKPVSQHTLRIWADEARNQRRLGGSHGDAMNITNITRIGTIEMRMHQGSLNGKKATEWVKFLTAFFDFSRDGHRLDDGDNVVEKMQEAGYLTTAQAEWLTRRQNRLNSLPVAV